MTMLFIDPDSGWKYGFPKQAPDNLRQMSIDELDAWFVENGYPKSEIDYWKSKGKNLPFQIFGKECSEI